MNKHQPTYSRVALVLCYLLMSYTALVFHPKWGHTQGEATLSWDVSGYYMYLPATFVYHDLKKCRFQDSLIRTYQPTNVFEQAFLDSASGNYIMKYTMGQALVMFPFFLIADTYCHLSHQYPTDGFSYPYQFCIGLGLFLLAFVGLFYLRKVLCFFFHDVTVAIVLIALVFGTNYLNFSCIDQGMAHSSLFTIYAIILYLSIRFHHTPSRRIGLTLGLLIGLATLIRPTEILTALIPILWNVSSYQQIQDKWLFIKTNRLPVWFGSLGFMLMIGLQLSYWKYVSGRWVVYSYGEQGFNWLHPHVADFMISYHSGWLLYCPMMLFAMLGIPLLLRFNTSRLFFLTHIFLSLYIATAWDIWDYGDTSGRAMIQYYPVLAFPMALLVEEVLKRKAGLFVFIPCFALFIYLNAWWTINAHAMHVQVTKLTKAYYWRCAGRWHATDDMTKLLDNPYSYEGLPVHPQVIYGNTFNADTTASCFYEDGDGKLRLSAGQQHTATYRFPKPENMKKWLRASADFTCLHKEWTPWKQAQFIVQLYREGNVVQTNIIRVYRMLQDGEHKSIYIDLIPEHAWDEAGVSFWNAEGEQTLIIDNLDVMTFDESSNLKR